MNIELNDENFKLLCARNYDSVDIYSFNEDIARAHMIKKMVKKYIQSSEINERLVLNHIIILFNVFGNFALTILYFIFGEDEYKYINSFLLFLDRLPENKFVHGVDISITRRLEKL